MNKNKSMLILLLIGTLTFIAGIFVYSRMEEIKTIEYIVLGVVIFIALLGTLVGIKNLKEEKKGLKTEDELSKKIREKAASHSFAASFYLWTIILASTIDSGINGKILLEIGLIGMCLIYCGFWFYHNNKGVDSEN